MRLPHDRSIFLYALLSGAPALAVALWFLWTGDQSFNLQLTLTLFIVLCWFGFATALHSRVVRPLQTGANLLAALREGDFSVRAHAARHDDPLGELFTEINQLSAVLHEQRLSAREATALLHEGGLAEHRHRPVRDQVAAQRILQSWFDQHGNA